MPPNVCTTTQQRSAVLEQDGVSGPAVGKPRPTVEIVWRSVVFFTIVHVFSVLGLLRALTSAHLLTSLTAFLCYLIGGIGVTAGAHRLWSHKSYSANFPLRVLLMLMYTMAGQNHIHEWARDHRLHHRHSETDADPHNAKRGFFFAHMGWLMVRKHPDIRLKGSAIDLADLENDSVVMFQKKFYFPLAVTIAFVIPMAIPWYFWGESLWNAFLICGMLKYAVILHCTWLVNSVAHMSGSKPYDRTISPSENKSVAMSAFGEGWHNYHHTFPWDYKTAELPGYAFNLTTAFIDFFARIGWAYNLKTVSKDVIDRRAERLGDGSRKLH